MARIVIIMGVSGCGKTTIGKLLSSKLELQFCDADDFHPKSNIIKLKNGMPLSDTDRKPWLDTLAMLTKEWSSSTGAVLACSALKESYRVLLMKYSSEIEWIYLSGSYELIKERIDCREDHFMQSNLLKSQFETLEIPTYGLHINIDQTEEEIVNEIFEKLKINA